MTPPFRSAAGVPLRRQRWTPAQDNQLRALAAQGLTWDEIGERIGRSSRAVHHRVLCLGVPRPTAGQTNAARRARRAGWPVMQGTPEEREQRFLAALLAEARACGLTRPAMPVATPQTGGAA